MSTETSFLNCRGRLISLEKPLIMGILNLTPDSFFDGGKHNEFSAAMDRVGQMLEEGADLIDIGGYSSRPGAEEISAAEELDRVAKVTEAVLRQYPEAIVSIDTFRASVAKAMLQAGAHIINDISAGLLDEQMIPAVADFDAPYIMMHMPGNPQTMQLKPEYDDVFEEVWAHLLQRVKLAQAAGIHDIIIDPGFGFGKTLDHNYELFGKLPNFKLMGLPFLVGISRKSMIYKLVGASPEEVLELSAVLHFKAMEAGAKILRVHDVRSAVWTRKLFLKLNS